MAFALGGLHDGVRDQFGDVAHPRLGADEIVLAADHERRLRDARRDVLDPMLHHALELAEEPPRASLHVHLQSHERNDRRVVRQVRQQAAGLRDGLALSAVHGRCDEHHVTNQIGSLDRELRDHLRSHRVAQHHHRLPELGIEGTAEQRRGPGNRHRCLGFGRVAETGQVDGHHPTAAHQLLTE